MDIAKKIQKNKKIKIRVNSKLKSSRLKRFKPFTNQVCTTKHFGRSFFDKFTKINKKNLESMNSTNYISVVTLAFLHSLHVSLRLLLSQNHYVLLNICRLN